MPNLFPEGYETEAVKEEDLADEKTTGYKEGVYFDAETQDFVRDGQHRVKSATGVESWESWCRNCLQTERGVYPCYSNTFGIATREALQAETREMTESILTREICEGLANDPYGRTKYVSDVSFEWKESDALHVSVQAVGIDNTTLDITTVIDVRMR